MDDHTQNKYSARGLAKLLKLHPTSVCKMISDGRLRAERQGNYRFTILHKDIITAAEIYPQYFNKASESGLIQLFDEDLVALIKKSTNPPGRKRKAGIRHTVTGQLFSRVQDAAIATSYSSASVRYHLSKKKKDPLFVEVSFSGQP